MLGPNVYEAVRCQVTQPCVTWDVITVGHPHNSDNSLSPPCSGSTALNQAWARPGLLFPVLWSAGAVPAAAEHGGKDDQVPAA